MTGLAAGLLRERCFPGPILWGREGTTITTHRVLAIEFNALLDSLSD